MYLVFARMSPGLKASNAYSNLESVPRCLLTFLTKSKMLSSGGVTACLTLTTKKISLNQS